MVTAVDSVLLLAGVVSAQATVPVEAQVGPYSWGKVFTYLFLTLGPFKVIAPFATMTHGRDTAFKRELAFRGTIVAAVGSLAAATIGASTLRRWGVSVGAVQLTAGIILFLVALKAVMHQYEPPAAPSAAAGSGATPALLPASKLAIVPLAFPTIVTPWGVAVLIILMTLGGGHVVEIFAIAAAVLVLDFLAMLGAEWILKTESVATALAIVGMVLGVLQVALGVQAMATALPMLGLS
jgi:multiple antibiotic resistance protein